jgi:type IV pilus assembly protein PilX
VLIVSLVMLLLLTLLGLAATRGSTLEEKMAGNSRDRQLAFQAAEAALRNCEALLGSTGRGSFNGANGLYDGANNAPDWDTIDWNDPSVVRTYPADLTPPLAGQPECFIVQSPESLPISGQSLAADAPPPNSNIYRVTSRGVGGDANAVVVLQSIYRH